MAGEAWLILPTYNEAENLEPLVRAALPVLEHAAPAGFRILVVDDCSPDGTGRIADDLASEHDYVSVLHRSVKEGLGQAYLAGFALALREGAGHVLEMDADFSHDPGDLARILHAAGDADLVLGSRYVQGGGVADWDAWRRLLSRGGCLYARAVLGLRQHDLTGGFKCVRRVSRAPWTRTRSSAIRPVPSGEPSSTTRILKPAGAACSRTGSAARTSGSRFSASL